MATQVGTGRSLDPRSHDAAYAAATDACRPLGDQPADVCLVFATACHDQRAILAGVAAATCGVPVAGCSGEGVISRAHSDECEYAVVVMAIRSTSMSFEPLIAPGYATDPAGAGARLSEAIAGGADELAGLLVFPDGLSGNCTDFLASITERASGTPPLLVGGGSADAMTFDATYQYHNDEVHTGAVSALAVRGGSFRVAVSHGCMPVGYERRVTSVDGEWVLSIDDEPAWTVFKDYLDGEPEDLNAEEIAHLCVGLPLGEDGWRAGYGSHVIRTPFSLDRASGALHFPGGGIRANQTIQITRRDPERIAASAEQCVREVWSDVGGRAPAAMLQFDCAGRGRILFGSRTSDQIVRPLQRVIGDAVPWIGVHTYGEIAPIGKQAYYHNYTVVLCALYDRAQL